MTDEIWESIQSYYEIYFGIGSIYERLAKAHCITSSALFVLCMIYEFPHECTQSFICEKLFYPKQTVNTILNLFEKQGYITKEALPNDRRSKYILLTDAGRKYACRIITDLQRVEETAFTNMRGDARRGMREGEREFLNQLSSAMDKFIETEQIT